MNKTLTIILVVLIAVAVILAFIFGFYKLIDWTINSKVEKTESKIKSQMDKAINNCLENGGIPIFSHWDNRLKRCD